MRKKSIIIVLFCMGMFILSACGGGTLDETAIVEGATESIRPEPPEGYADLTNPYEGESEAEAEGVILFQANCSSCHGPTGQGDGPAGSTLDPKPLKLAENQKGLSDAYIFWRISEGGLIGPFYSVMPVWRGLLNEEQIWQIIAFLRTLRE